jgi:hypothetical protein
MQELPIACSLSAVDLQTRLAEIAAIGRSGLRASSVADDRSVLRFAGDRALRARLEAIVAAEAECCAFLTLSLYDDGDELVLTIVAPPGAEPVGAELAAAFGARSGTFGLP